MVNDITKQARTATATPRRALDPIALSEGQHLECVELWEGALTQLAACGAIGRTCTDPALVRNLAEWVDGARFHLDEAMEHILGANEFCSRLIDTGAATDNGAQEVRA